MSRKIAPHSTQEIAHGCLYVAHLDFKAKERFCDEIAATQPVLLAHAVAPALEFGSYEKADHVLHVLMVLYRVFVHAPQKRLRQITEEDIEAVSRNNVAMFKLLDSESLRERERITRLSALSYPEINAFAFLMGYLSEHGFAQIDTDKKLFVLAAKNILDCLVKLKHETQGQTQERTVV